jgi:hypothetical protein
LIQTPGDANRAGVTFGSRKLEITGRIGRKSADLEPWESELDLRIAPYVKALREHGVETFESCEGGAGHAFPEPTIRFHGQRPEGFRALAVARTYEMPVGELRRSWPLIDGEPTGPYWELTFYLPSLSRREQ